MDIILRPSGRSDKSWSLQLRNHASVGETEYFTIAHIGKDLAFAIDRYPFGAGKEPGGHTLLTDGTEVIAFQIVDLNMKPAGIGHEEMVLLIQGQVRGLKQFRFGILGIPRNSK